MMFYVQDKICIDSELFETGTPCTMCCALPCLRCLTVFARDQAMILSVP